MNRSDLKVEILQALFDHVIAAFTPLLKVLIMFFTQNVRIEKVVCIGDT